MIEKKYKEQINVMNHVLFSPEGRFPGQTDTLKHLADITCSAALLLERNGKVLEGYLSSKAGKKPERYSVMNSVTDDSGVMSFLKAGESLYNQTYPSDENMKETKNRQAENEDLYFSVFLIPGKHKSAVSLLLITAQKLTNPQILAAEIGVMLLAMALGRSADEKQDAEFRNRNLAEAAFDSLSYSEVEAINEILKNIDNQESVVVASKIADRLGITRSVIVNALRKFESAGIIESRSLGMKGTFIRVKNPQALEIISSRSSRMNPFV